MNLTVSLLFQIILSSTSSGSATVATVIIISIIVSLSTISWCSGYYVIERRNSHYRLPYVVHTNFGISIDNSIAAAISNSAAVINQRNQPTGIYNLPMQRLHQRQCSYSSTRMIMYENNKDEECIDSRGTFTDHITNSFHINEGTKKSSPTNLSVSNHISTTIKNHHDVVLMKQEQIKDLIYHMYIHHETDGIRELGASITSAIEIISSKVGIETTEWYNTYINVNEEPQFLFHLLSYNELWTITKQAAVRIATDSNNQGKKPSSGSTNRTKHLRPACNKQNQPSSTVGVVRWTGIAASMLNGWIASCCDIIDTTIASSAKNGCNENKEQEQEQQVQQQQNDLAQYAEQLFHVATLGEDTCNDVSKNNRKDSSHGHETKSQQQQLQARTHINATTSMVVIPDIVTYSLLYTLFHSINQQQKADFYLQSMQRQSKKMAGSQRRRLLSKTTSSIISGTVPRNFRMFEERLQSGLNLQYDKGNQNDQTNHEKSHRLILHEDENYLVVNKPSGICCYHTHVTTAGKRNMDVSLINAFQSIDPTMLSTLNPSALGVVHRLDRGTSGCIIIAKNDVTHAMLVSHLFRRNIKKTYTVLVSPAPCMKLYNNTGYISIPVDDKPAKSYYTIIERFSHNYTDNKTGRVHTTTAALMNVTTYTGRQHQVRVHCSYGLSSPIIGDTVYSISTKITPVKATRHKKTKAGGPINARNLMNSLHITGSDIDQGERFHLHATSVSLPASSSVWNSRHGGSVRNETMIFTAPIPCWWTPVIMKWRQQSRT